MTTPPRRKWHPQAFPWLATEAPSKVLTRAHTFPRETDTSREDETTTARSNTVTGEGECFPPPQHHPSSPDLRPRWSRRGRAGELPSPEQNSGHHRPWWRSTTTASLPARTGTEQARTRPSKARPGPFGLARAPLLATTRSRPPPRRGPTRAATSSHMRSRIL
jgi:hypothetical protein